MKRSVALITALAALIVAAPAALHAQSQCDAVVGNLVKNCGFEDHALTWTPSVPTGGFFGPDGVRVHSGGGAWDFSDLDGLAVFHTEAYDDANEAGYLSQTFATTVGQTYTLSFWLLTAEGTNPAPYSGSFLYNLFTASWNGATVFMIKDRNPFTSVYEHFVVTDLVATSATTELTLGGFEPISSFVLDDVVVEQVTPAVVGTPEPATALLVLPGFAGVLFARRRRAGLLLSASMPHP